MVLVAKLLHCSLVLGAAVGVVLSLGCDGEVGMGDVWVMGRALESTDSDSVVSDMGCPWVGNPGGPHLGLVRGETGMAVELSGGGAMEASPSSLWPLPTRQLEMSVIS